MWRAPGATAGSVDELAEAELLVARGHRDAAVVPAVDERVQLEQHRGLQLVEPRVVADVLERDLVLRAVEAQDARALARPRRSDVVIRPPSPKHGQVLGREERERRGVAEGAAAHAAERRAEGLRRVLEQREPVPRADRAQRPHRGRVAEQVHRHDRARARRDRGLDGLRIEAVACPPRCPRTPGRRRRRSPRPSRRRCRPGR